MTHQKDAPFLNQNQGYQVPKSSKKRFKLRHLTHGLTHQMTLREVVLIPEHNHHSQLPKTIKKRPQNRHLTHQMTHGLTHHLEHNSASVSWLAEMAVAAIRLGIFNKKYSTRFLPLLTSPVSRCQITARIMSALPGTAHSLNFISSTI